MRRLLLLGVFAALLFFLGALYGAWAAERRLRPQIDWAVQQAVEQSEIAKSWQREHEQVYRLVEQWRRGYQELAKRCPDGR